MLRNKIKRLNKHNRRVLYERVGYVLVEKCQPYAVSVTPYRCLQPRCAGLPDADFGLRAGEAGRGLRAMAAGL
jgi:hypothetical protein